MLKLDRFSCSQKIQLKQDPPVLSKILSGFTENANINPIAISFSGLIVYKILYTLSISE